MNYARNIDELQKKAVMWWPDTLTKLENSSSIIPLLLRTQDDFISVLSLSKENPTQIFDVLKASKFRINLFLKHLIVLADFGGEQLQRINSEFDNLFPAKDKKRSLQFVWHDKIFEYIFKTLPVKGLTNKKLKVDGPGLLELIEMSETAYDVIMLLLYGSSSTNEKVAEVFNKCHIGTLLGMPEELEKYIKQKYILVSRITGGAESNSLGQIAQKYVADYLSKSLGKDYEVKKNGTIPDITQNDGRTLISFDIVVRKGKKYVAVEISFQVTTNSVIERKGGQARDRYKMLKERGHFIAYILDGAGNFQRRSAVSTICQNSDCTLAFNDKELDLLIQFAREKVG